MKAMRQVALAASKFTVAAMTTRYRSSIAALMLFTVLSPVTGGAQANAPDRASPLQLSLVTGYKPCTAPNATHNGFVPACNPATRNDAICGFGSGGVGSFSIKEFKGASPPMESRVVIRGLDHGCEGRTLCQVTAFRVTNSTDAGCGPGGCTIETTLGPPTGCCTVEAGRCTILQGGRVIAHGIHQGASPTQEAALLGCGVIRTTGPSLPTKPTFECGYMVDR